MAITEGTRIILLGSVGKCEHCKTLITLTDLPSEAIDSPWYCPQCHGTLSGKSFGYEGAKKTKWIGVDGEWTTTKPTESFILGGWEIIPNMPPHSPFSLR